MPPQLSDDEMESDGPDEIPAKITPAKLTEDDPVEDEEDDDEDEDGEEFRVENILSHRFVGKSGSVEYEIKWLGYDKKADRTWEPIENLENAMDLVNEYHDKIGGAPISGKAEASASKRKSAETKSNKRTSAALFDSPSVQPNANKRAKANGTKEAAFVLPSGSWEDQVLRVHTVLEEDDPNALKKGGRTLLGLVEWEGQRKTQHPLHVLRRRCPQKLLDYYEAHLVFRTATAKDDAQADAAATITEE